MKNWKFWFWLIIILIGVMFDYDLISLNNFLVATYILAAAAFYNTLIVNKNKSR